MKTNLTYLKNMSGGNPEVIREMIGLFIEQVQEISEAMLQSLELKDWVSLSKLAHKAKSSVSIMGMNDLAEKLKYLEHSAFEEKDIDSYQPIVNQFMVDCSDAIEELKNYELAVK